MKVFIKRPRHAVHRHHMTCYRNIQFTIFLVTLSDTNILFNRVGFKTYISTICRILTTFVIKVLH